jgi:putative chitinase
MITKEQLMACCPACKNLDGLLPALNFALPKYNISTVDEIAGFLAQCGHESGDFNTLEENLNYKAESLMRVWPKRFPDIGTANAYAHAPGKIADKVYANRMGNGDEASGDGWLYHGRGAIQLTGKTNYQAFAYEIEQELSAIPAYLTTLKGAVESACWFWNTNKLSPLADAENIEAMTRKINGGLIGEDDREARYERCKAALA